MPDEPHGSDVASTLGETNLALYRIAAIHGRIADSLELLGGWLMEDEQEHEYQRDNEHQHGKKNVNVRLDCHFHIHGDPRDGNRLERIEALLKIILNKENEQMAFQQDAIDAIAQGTTLIGSVRTLVEQVLSGMGDQVTPEAKARILEALSGNRTELQAVERALLDNTTPPPPV